MYNYWRGCAENCGIESLASNQVVGGSNPSGCANLIKHLTHSRKLASAHKSAIRPQKKNIKMVIGHSGGTVGMFVALAGIAAAGLVAETV